jgi:hypothetical protein
MDISGCIAWKLQDGISARAGHSTKVILIVDQKPCARAAQLKSSQFERSEILQRVLQSLGEKIREGLSEN